MKYVISNLYIGISFETGQLLPLLKKGESFPDRLFGNNQSYQDLYDMHYYYVNDAGIDMSNCSSLFCVRPLKEYIKYTTDTLSKERFLEIFEQVIPLYLEDQYVRNKIIEVQYQYKMYINNITNDITKTNNDETKNLLKNLLKGYLEIINNLENIILKFGLNQDKKVLRKY